MTKTILTALATAAVLFSAPSRAQELGANEERVLDVLAKRQQGVVLIDARAGEPTGKISCSPFGLAIKQVGGKEPIGINTTSGFATFALNPGQYQVIAAQCTYLWKITWLEPFARFEVRAGELVDVGVLYVEQQSKEKATGNVFVEVKQTITLRKAVEPMPAERRAALTQRMPRAMARLTVRRMTVVAPATMAMQMSISPSRGAVTANPRGQ